MSKIKHSNKKIKRKKQQQKPKPKTRTEALQLVHNELLKTNGHGY